MTYPASFQYLLACGARDDEIALFERLIANDTLQPASAIPVFDKLSASPIDIPYNAYNRVSMYAAVEVRDAEYQERFPKMLLRSMNMEDFDYFDAIEQLVPPIQRYVKHPSEISARRLCKAFDFDYLISPHHAAEDTLSKMFFKTLRRHHVDVPAFHTFALFICLTSANPHIVQNFLYALLVTAGPVPFALLDVLGRYEIYNLASYALIERVPGLGTNERLSLILTHFKSMDETFYFGKLDVIETSGHEQMQHWAALNTSNDPSILYFCDTLMAEETGNDHLLAALDHYIWCVSTLEDKNDGISPERGKSLRMLEGRLHDYLAHNLNHLSVSDSIASLMRRRYGELSRLSARYQYSGTAPQSAQAIGTLLDLIATFFAQECFDGVVAARAPDLPNEGAGYSSLLRPAGHRYDLFIQAKIRAPDRWFYRELKRVEAHDFANWGTLCLVLKTAVQFNALCAWLLKEMAQKALPSSALDHLIGDTFIYYPATSDLLLHARQFFAKVLASQKQNWVLRALSALYNHKAKGHHVPPELKPALEALDTATFKRLHLHFLDRLLEED